MPAATPAQRLWAAARGVRCVPAAAGAAPAPARAALGQRQWKWVGAEMAAAPSPLTPPPLGAAPRGVWGGTGVGELFSAAGGELHYGDASSWSASDLAAFLDWLAENEGVRTVADLHSLTDDVFSKLTTTATRTLGVPAAVWAVVEDARYLSPDVSLPDALARFGTVLNPTHEVLLESVPDVGTLQQLHHDAFMKLDVPAGLQTTLQHIRERNRFASRHMLTVIDLPCPRNRMLNKVLKRLLKYQLPDVSWRKSEATSQTVVSAITYAPGCKCVRGDTKYAGRTPSAKGAANTEPPMYPGAWCTCERKTVYAVNYELSTPSGSRCAEQNALGRIAAVQPPVPTSSIREVFVRGIAAPGLRDPNPLSPCGTCENMISKLSKHVSTAHGGGEIMLFMVDTQTRSPTKLVALPFSEISVRASAGFQTFVMNNLRAPAGAGR